MRTLKASSNLYGRDAELAILHQALDRVAAGGAAVVLVEGEAGIGKTSLLNAAADAARTQRMTVAVSRAVELEQTRPFGALAAALECRSTSADPRRVAIAELLSPSGASGRDTTVSNDPGLRFRVVDAMADLVEELAVDGPVVLCIDDLQWADSSSILTLSAVIARTAYLPVAVFGGLRPLPRNAELDRIVDTLIAPTAAMLRVGRLADDPVRRLLAEMTGLEPSSELMKSVAGAGGNPLYIRELVSALVNDGAIHPVGGRSDLATSGLPPSLGLTILRRLSFLPEATLIALRSASILGSSFAVTELSVTTAQSALTLSSALAPAVTAGVVEADDAQLRFRHDLIRDAIYFDLPLAVRLGLHREAGARLADAGASVQQVAEQLARGATPGDETAIDFMFRAAGESLDRSPTIAADLLGRAIALMTPGDPRADEWTLVRARALVSAGQVSLAISTCRELLHRSNDPDVEGPVRLCLGHALLVSGRAKDGLVELQLAASSQRLTDAQRAAVLGWACACRIWMADVDGAFAAASDARAAAQSIGDDMLGAMSLSMMSVASRLRGR